MKRIILTCLLILTGFVTLSWIEVWYWRYWPLEPIKVCPEITVLNPGKMVTAGQLMIYEVAFDKRMDVSCKVKRQLVNSYRIDYDPIEPPRKELGPQKAISSIHVPGLFSRAGGQGEQHNPGEREISGDPMTTCPFCWRDALGHWIMGLGVRYQCHSCNKEWIELIDIGR
jgi:hypothetical protein